MTQTYNFRLPLLVQGQAQKEISHNEALLLIDILLNPVVEKKLDNPALLIGEQAPIFGNCYLIGETPTGIWANYANYLAVYFENGWRYIAPKINLRIWSKHQNKMLRYDGNIWGGGNIVTAPNGGTTIDVEARSTLAQILSLLQAQGLSA
ncbi:hypothetical protein LPB140_11050 [Sphingorhabdus lutea]|uniref:DUF2793 domain-containing protein n=1 Tax=Sphingorhabdus lutea TaxID=1913578 RepID=A0A1L3JDW2_9SPHN|nr:DUF2793 domain-containing protein [Sphingorhabdus lutea]APG63233.1 hypothetical protein LPB140_11050 [Sphingorhabdus lutea]